MRTPVFLISFNRGAMLENSIRGLRRMTRPLEIVVQDNGSNDPTTLAILDRLDEEGIRVIHGRRIDDANELNELNDTIQNFFSNRPLTDYIVSDCDIDLGIAHPDALDVYGELLRLLPQVSCIGPMLRIRDIPITYPLFNRVMNRHIEQFWGKRPQWLSTSRGRVAYIDAPIDTTMALHRAGEPFYRLKAGARVYDPYEARHLDWYVGGDSDVYARTSSRKISHWNNQSETGAFRDVALEYSTFYAVRSGLNGLEEYQESVVGPKDSK